MFRVGLAAALFSVLSSQASAQITTYVAPPKPAGPTKQMVASADSARRDSIQAVQMSNMKVWVDSAAGVSVPAGVGDTLAIPANDPGLVTESQPERPVTTTFSNGSVAPATATQLPTLVIAGAVVLVIGAALVTHRPRG